MKNFLSVLCTVVLVLGLAGVAGAATYEFNPNDSSGDPDDLWDLSHGQYYTWGVDVSLAEDEAIVGASLFFDDIRNWQTEVNDLWVHLLDSTVSGAHEYNDPQSGQTDFFQGLGVLLNQWHNLPSTPQDITYIFNTSEIAALNSYVADDNFGFGFDPDCHFYNNGIKLTIETISDPVVPEPSTILLVSLGLVGLLGLGRKQFKK